MDNTPMKGTRIFEARPLTFIHRIEAKIRRGWEAMDQEWTDRKEIRDYNLRCLGQSL